jgi:hypothetical protein
MKMTDEIRAHTKALLVPENCKRARKAPKAKTKSGRNYSLWCRSYASDALGVNPEQISEARAGARAQGVDVDFDKEGRAIIKSDKHFRDVARATGMYDGGQGYDVKGDDGFKRSSGRAPVQERERLKKLISDWD